MARILIVDDEDARHMRFLNIFQAHLEVRPEMRVVETKVPNVTQYRWTAKFSAPHEVVSARSYRDAILHMGWSPRTWDLVCLDHDLGEEEEGRDGRGLARWMAGLTQDGQRLNGWRCPAKKVLIHSRNPIAAAEMAAIFLEMPNAPFVKLLPFQPVPT